MCLGYLSLWSYDTTSWVHRSITWLYRHPKGTCYRIWSWLDRWVITGAWKDAKGQRMWEPTHAHEQWKEHGQLAFKVTHGFQESIRIPAPSLPSKDSMSASHWLRILINPLPSIAKEPDTPLWTLTWVLLEHVPVNYHDILETSMYIMLGIHRSFNMRDACTPHGKCQGRPFRTVNHRRLSMMCCMCQSLLSFTSIVVWCVNYVWREYMAFI